MPLSAIAYLQLPFCIRPVVDGQFCAQSNDGMKGSLRMNKLTRRNFLKVFGIAGATGAIAACGNSGSEEPAAEPEAEAEAESEPEAPSTKDIDVNDEEAWKAEPMYGKKLYYYYFDGCSAGPNMADYLGYFKEAGLDVEGLRSEVSAAESIGTNATQIVIDHIATELVPSTNGSDITFVGGAHIGCKSLYVLGDSEYQSTHDLIGKTIAVPGGGIGGADYNICARFFDRDGIDPLTEIEMKPVDSGACIQAMQNGELGGAILSDAFAYDFVADGTLRRVRSLTFDEDFMQEPCCVIVMNKSFVDENPITAARMARAVDRAHDWMRENMDECVDIMIEQGLASGSHEKVFDFLTSLKFGLDDDFTERALKDIIHDYVKLGLITSTDDEAAILERVWTPLLDD